MAVVANTFQSTSATGNREELSDVVSRITPEDTPIYSMIEKVNFKTTHPEWETDDLAAPAENIQLEGDEYAFGATTPADRMAEAEMNRELRTRDQIVQSTVSFTDGYGTAPGDMLAPIALYDAQGCEMNAVTMAQTGTIPLRCRQYAVSGSEIIGPAEGDFVFQYYAQIPSITAQAANATSAAHISGGVGTGTYPSGSGTNWVLQRYPEAYLYGVETRVERHLRNLEAAQAADAFFKDQLRAIRRDDASARYSRARVKVAGVTP